MFLGTSCGGRNGCDKLSPSYPESIELAIDSRQQRGSIHQRFEGPCAHSESSSRSQQSRHTR